jgi:transposase-like protein
MGISVPDEVVTRFQEDCKEYFAWINEGSLPENALHLIMDAKQVEIKHEGKVRKATVYIAVLVDFEYKRRFCACKITFGRENGQEWLTLLTSLVNRGLKRVLVITSDAFPGITQVTETVYEEALHQLCVAHMIRNVFRNMNKVDAKQFKREFGQIKDATSFSDAETLFETLLQKYESKYPNFIAELRKNGSHYLVFTKFPESVRKHIYTSNLPEGINSAIEKKRKEVAGYFRSEDHFKAIFVVLAKHLHNGKWSRPHVYLKANDYELRQMFAAVYGVRP